MEKLRDRVSCGTVLETSGFEIDLRESTRRALKFRNGAEIIIVTHEGRGWFDPLGNAKGDVFSLVGRIDSVGFSESVVRVAALSGFRPTLPVWKTVKEKKSLE
ncbi:hypothetical protein [Rhizobium sp.]|uniref:hypothetical protein n=1 Tax=Rhizobium sp. TaxID=391 RepID=UPI0028A9069F